MKIIIAFYILAIAAIELIGIQWGNVVGLVGHALLIELLLSQYARNSQSEYRSVLLVLVLCPLLRILSFTIPFPEAPKVYWYAMVGLPLLIAIRLTYYTLQISLWQAVRLGAWKYQILVAATGIPLSLLAYSIWEPNPLTQNIPHRILIGVAFLTVFGAFTEEVLFRGLFQDVAAPVVGSKMVVVYSSVLFAAMYLGSLSWGYVAFMGAVGLLWGWCVQRTGTIWGTVLAHSILSVGMLIVFPLM